jgi:hypothetical protein
MQQAPNSHEAPRLSIVVPDPGDDFLTIGVLPSLAAGYQVEVAAPTYEVVLVTTPDRAPLVAPGLAGFGAQTEVVQTADVARSWISLGWERARGSDVALIGAPGIASPTLLAAIYAARDAYPDSALVIPTFGLDAPETVSDDAWLRALGWPANAAVLAANATLDYQGPPRHRWLDPIEPVQNLVVDRKALARMVATEARSTLDELARRAGGPRVQMVGDALVRLERGAERRPPAAASTGGPVDASLEFFGRVSFAPQLSVARPTSFSRPDRCRFSIVVMTYNMRREAPRTLQSLLPPYQKGIEREDCEIIVIDNGSTDRLSPGEVQEVAPGADYHMLENPPPSPAHALNYGAARTDRDVLLLQSDGASILSPGVLEQAAVAFRCFPRPVVITQYFFVGPGPQNETILRGYDKREEDGLLDRIAWPSDGYRLLEIASPQTLEVPEGAWLGGWYESDCILMPRSVFEEIGGFDERFALPGGGLAVMDLLFRAWALPDVQPVKLIGEGVFHQLHGGITTNTTPELLADEVRRYKEQYTALRGPVPVGVPKSFYFIGGLRNSAAREKMKG